MIRLAESCALDSAANAGGYTTLPPPWTCPLDAYPGIKSVQFRNRLPYFSAAYGIAAGERLEKPGKTLNGTGYA
jgi:hypothetical protein